METDLLRASRLAWCVFCDDALGDDDEGKDTAMQVFVMLYTRAFVLTHFRVDAITPGVRAQAFLGSFAVVFKMCMDDEPRFSWSRLFGACATWGAIGALDFSGAADPVREEWHMAVDVERLCFNRFMQTLTRTPPAGLPSC
jgi:hypothetical protein